ncbi:hypothetical protein ALC53_10407 [Atta colombica]|uniref:Transmembrane protein n=1 Tax=Atta colombica TaxID=520822 RepID=A0A195B430_9HYME|nr:hypothetical protein ALC53_10407 [Atta colombica]
MLTTWRRALRRGMTQQSTVILSEIRRMLQLQRMPRFPLIIQTFRTIRATVRSRFAPLALGSTLDARRSTTAAMRKRGGSETRVLPEDDVNRAHRPSLFILRGPSTQPVASRPAQSRASNSRKSGLWFVFLFFFFFSLIVPITAPSIVALPDRAHRKSAKYKLTAARVSTACTSACC